MPNPFMKHTDTAKHTTSTASTKSAAAVTPTDTPTTPIDPFTAVDYGGNVINIGDFVDLYYCKVVGFRADANNRLNLLVVPALNSIVTVDPNNPLTGQVDGKAILVSGYNCVAYAASGGLGDGASKTSKIDAAKTQAGKDAAILPTSLPSNFLAPSIE